MSKGAIFVRRSKNVKVGNVSATYASIKNTCSSTCPLKANRSCYAMNSFVGMVNRRMNSRARQYSPLQVARSEAKAINESYRGGKVPAGRMMRMHVSGDCKVVKGVRLLAKAAVRWTARQGGPIWSYTHSHAHVPRKEWGTISVLASIESVSQVAAVRASGYAPALVINSFVSDKAFSVPGCDTVFIPCPAQTKDKVSCESCKLCTRADWLFATNKGIAFAVHGIRSADLKRHLAVVS